MRYRTLSRGAAALLVCAASAGSFADDTDEPNGSALEATACGRVGFLRTGRVLAVLDEDWYRFDVPLATGPVTVELSYNKSSTDALFNFEVQSAFGALVASGSPPDLTGVARAVTGPLAAGSYLVRIRHDAGSEIGSYSLHARVQNDADEPNESQAAAVFAGQAGFVRSGLVLNIGDADWYRITLPSAVDALNVDASWDAGYSAATSLEVRTAAGSFVASGSLTGSAGPMHATTGALAAGDYLIGFRHLSGGAISSYSLQAAPALSFVVPASTETSVGVTTDLPLTIAGGVKPYSVVIDSRFTSPPGIAYDAANSRLTGVPALAGRYEFMITCRDAGSPASSISAFTTLIVNAQLAVKLGEFTAFARDKAADRAIPTIGGTGPFAVETTSGTLPHGLTLSGSGLMFSGAADQAGSAQLGIKMTDALGFADDVTTTAVVCEPLGVVSLAEGDAACGVWLDAVKGSSITVNVSTAKKAAKRELRAVLLSPDGTTPIEAKIRSASGKAVLSGITAQASGRYFVILASGEGAATTLTASAKITPLLKGSGHEDEFAAGDQVTIPVGLIAGSILTFTAKADAASELEVRVQALIAPSGVQIALGTNDVVAKGGGFVFTRTFAEGGTWTIVVAGSRAGPGDLSYKYSVKPPKGAAYSHDGQ